MNDQTPTRSSSLGNSQGRSDQVDQMRSQGGQNVSCHFVLFQSVVPQFHIKCFHLELVNEVKALKMEVQGLKRTIGDMAGQQSELLRLVKSLKKSNDVSHFDLRKSCHTVCLPKCIPQYLITTKLFAFRFHRS